MKRSEINAAIEQATRDFASVGFALPAFAGWSLEEWREHAEGSTRLIEEAVGWDVTDFGAGRFAQRGLLLFTTRNGTPKGGRGNRPYAEKIMISRRDQLTPMHRHYQKVEDIINRAALSSGAVLAVKLFATAADGTPDRDTRHVVFTDGEEHEVEPGAIVRLAPGQSITLFPGTYHAFWGEGGDVVVGEVSSVNDDTSDNHFAEPLERFTELVEDAPVTWPLAQDLRALLRA